MRVVVAPRLSLKKISHPQRSQHAAKKRVARILATLEQSIPDATVALNSKNPLELLVATILSAQCTDERVNQVTPNLFARYRTAEDFAKADQAELELFIKSTGFFKSKARHLIGCGKALVTQFHGRIPESMAELTTLPGVGRKTANVILGSYFGEPAVVVDTHVKRVANRLGLTGSQDPTKIEEDLQSLMPQSQWTIGAQRLLLHGRHVCQARSPHCDQCSLYDDCEWEGKRKLT
jgi:endonuclease-3